MSTISKEKIDQLVATGALTETGVDFTQLSAAEVGSYITQVGIRATLEGEDEDDEGGAIVPEEPKDEPASPPKPDPIEEPDPEPIEGDEEEE